MTKRDLALFAILMIGVLLQIGFWVWFLWQVYG